MIDRVEVRIGLDGGVGNYLGYEKSRYLITNFPFPFIVFIPYSPPKNKRFTNQ